MDLIVRAYDHEQLLRAESLPVQRLWTLLESGGMRDRAHERAGLMVPTDLWVRETLVSRLEALLQEGYGRESLTFLSAPQPPTLVYSRHSQWPPIDAVEAVQLREDLVRYFTFGLWRCENPEVIRLISTHCAGTGAMPTLDQAVREDGSPDLSFLVSLAVFSEHFAPLSHGKAAEVDVSGTSAAEMERLWSYLAQASQIYLAAKDANLRVIVYDDRPENSELTAADSKQPALGLSIVGALQDTREHRA